MGIDVGGFYFGTESVKGVAIYNEVYFKFTKKRRKLHKKAVRSHNNLAVVRNLLTMESSYDADRFTAVDVISEEEYEEGSFEKARRVRVEGKKGIAEYMKKSFNGCCWEFYGVPYVVGKTRTVPVNIVEPTKIDNSLTAETLECNSKTIYWIFNHLAEKVEFPLFYWSDYSFHIPVVSLEYIKKSRHPLNHYLGDVLKPIPEEVLSRLDSALESTVSYLEEHLQYENVDQVKNSLTKVVRAFKENKTTVIVDVSR